MERRNKNCVVQLCSIGWKMSQAMHFPVTFSAIVCVESEFSNYFASCQFRYGNSFILTRNRIAPFRNVEHEPATLSVMNSTQHATHTQKYCPKNRTIPFAFYYSCPGAINETNYLISCI